MKIKRYLPVRQAVILAIAATVIAIALKLFAPLAIAILVLIAFVALVYAAALQWAPEFFEDAKTT